VADSEKSKRKPRVRKAPVSYRQAMEKQQAKATGTKARSPRRARARKVATTPFITFWRVLKRVLKPLSFMLIPFRTRPLRLIGRILARIFWPKWLRNAAIEVRQVNWPGRRETWKLTFAVFVFAIMFGTLISLVDYGLDKVFERIILR
jgi:preprotein translocase SecE subunit